MKNQWIAAPALGALLFVSGLACGSDKFYDTFPDHADLLREIPTTSSATAKDIFLKLAPDATEISAKLIPFLTTGTDENTTARLTLSGLAQNVGQYGTNAQKKQLAEAFVDGIDKVEDPASKAILMELLVWIGDSSVAPALTQYLSDDRLVYRVARTLIQLSPSRLNNMLTAALDQESAANKAQILLVMDYLPARNLPIEKITSLANDRDAAVRKAALDLLATAGAKNALPLIQTDLATSQGALHRAYAYTRTIRWITNAESVPSSQRKALALELLQKSAETSATAEFAQAAEALRETDARAATTEMAEWLTDDREEIRDTALFTLLKVRSSSARKAITDTLVKTEEPEVAVDMLRALGKTNSKEVMPAIEAAVKRENAEIRNAALLAGGQVDRSRMKATLVKLLGEGDKDVKDVVTAELNRVKDSSISQEIARSFSQASDAGKVTILEWLAGRNHTKERDTVYQAVESETPAVRSAALKALEGVVAGEDLERLLTLLNTTTKESELVAIRKAFLAASRRLSDPTAASTLLLDKFDDASLESKIQLLPVLSTLSSSETLPMVISNAQTSETPELQDAAVRALATWEDPEAIEALMKLAGKENETKHRALAYRGILRLSEKVKPAEARLETLSKAGRLAASNEDRQLLIGTLAEIRTLKSMKQVYPFLKNQEVRDEAALALYQIAIPEKGRPLNGIDAGSMLKSAIPYITDEKKRIEAAEFVNKYELEAELEPLPPADDEGFHSLFNGTDLKGWVGDTDGYEVKDGAIVCLKATGGQLMTARQFSDFVLRFDFVLFENGNNGVGIRTPLNADAAYDGLEIQILDNNGPQYKEIKPWQRHGSIYGIAEAADTEYKPYGEWNTEEIRVEGTKVTVTVNGKVITTYDLKDSADGTVDGKPHPGIDRNRGHIGFLGHGHEVRFRNIRIKPLVQETPEGYTNLLESGDELQEWKAAPANPVKHAALPDEERAAKEAEGIKEVKEQWSVNEFSELIHTGKTPSLATREEYQDFELLAEWAIGPRGDSAFYLRNTPQVQIWDPQQWDDIGSGGLYNNQKHTSLPLELADRPLGQWNQFKIVLRGEKVNVDLNGKRVVDDTPLENYWDRGAPLLPSGNIEIQSHQSPVYLRNIFVRPLSGDAAQSEAPADAASDAATTSTLSSSDQETSPSE